MTEPAERNLTLLEKPINIVAGNDFYGQTSQVRQRRRYLTHSLVALTDVGQNTSISRINAKLELFLRGMRQASKRHAILIALAGCLETTIDVYRFTGGRRGLFLRPPHLADPACSALSARRSRSGVW